MRFAKHYVSLIAIITESDALYSIFAVIFLVLYAMDNPINQDFVGIASFTQVSILSKFGIHCCAFTAHAFVHSKYHRIP